MNFYKILGWAAVIIFVMVAVVAMFAGTSPVPGTVAGKPPVSAVPVAPASSGNKQFY